MGFDNRPFPKLRSEDAGDSFHYQLPEDLSEIEVEDIAIEINEIICWPWSDKCGILTRLNIDFDESDNQGLYTLEVPKDMPHKMIRQILKIVKNHSVVRSIF